VVQRCKQLAGAPTSLQALHLYEFRHARRLRRCFRSRSFPLSSALSLNQPVTKGPRKTSRWPSLRRIYVASSVELSATDSESVAIGPGVLVKQVIVRHPTRRHHPMCLGRPCTALEESAGDSQQMVRISNRTLVNVRLSSWPNGAVELGYVRAHGCSIPEVTTMERTGVSEYCSRLSYDLRSQCSVRESVPVMGQTNHITVLMGSTVPWGYTC